MLFIFYIIILFNISDKIEKQMGKTEQQTKKSKPDLNL